MRGFSRHAFTDKAWGRHIIWVPHHTESNWGILAPVIGTEWEPLFPVVDNDLIGHALKGNCIPLLNVIGRPPQKWGLMLPEEVRRCAEYKTCASYNAKTCWPSSNTPDCYSVVHEIGDVLIQVVLRWRDGEYVLITR